MSLTRPRPLTRSRPLTHRRSRTHRWLAAALLSASLLLAPATAHAVDPALADPPAAGASWLTDQLVDGDHFEAVYGPDSYPDHGLTADAVLALLAAGGPDGDRDAMTAWLQATAGDYDGAAYGDLYVAGTVKLALVATATGADPRSFGGRDLLADLAGLATETGRYSDLSAYGDYSNTITQSLALIVLARTQQPVPASAVAFLIGQQCADGGFQAQVRAAAEPCASDPDSTGFALQALAAAGGTGAAGDAGIAARDWLRTARLADGHWDAEGTVNAAALGAAGLLLVGEDVSTTRAWLAGAQLADGSLPVNPGGSSGDARATTQAVLALAGESLLSVGAGGLDRVSLVASPTPAAAPAAPAVTASTVPATLPATDPVTTAAAARQPVAGAELAATGSSSGQGAALALCLVALGVGLLVAARPSAAPPRHRTSAIR